MLGKRFRWCDYNCGKTVIFTLKEWGNTKKRLFVCQKCKRNYILQDRNILKEVKVK